MRTLLLLVIISLTGCLFAKPQIPITRISVPPVIDGVETDPCWMQVAPLPGPTTYRPEEGKQPRHATRCSIAYDDKYFYACFVNQIDDPSKLRATVSEREKWPDDDQVAIAFDVYNSNRFAYIFNLNPYGNVQDWISHTNGQSNNSWDIPLRAAAHIYPDRWVAEIAIPFNSIPFDDSRPEQDWGFYYLRSDKDADEFSVYPPRTKDIMNLFIQSGQLSGMTGVKSGHQLKIMPYGYADYLREWGEQSADNRVDAGLDLEYSLSSTVSLSASFNPDYSQIEADAFNIRVNKRDLVWLDEKRPFFSSGMDFYQSGLNSLIYTRKILNPLYGVKVAGVFPERSVGLTSIYDEGEGKDSRAMYTLGRWRQNIGSESYIGLLSTTRNDLNTDGISQIAASDMLIKFTDTVKLMTQSVWSFDRAADSLSTVDGWQQQFFITQETPDLETTVAVIATSRDFTNRIGQVDGESLDKINAEFKISNRLLANTGIVENLNWMNDLQVCQTRDFTPYTEIAATGFHADWAGLSDSEVELTLQRYRKQFYDTLATENSLADYRTVQLRLHHNQTWSGSLNTWLDLTSGTAPFYGDYEHGNWDNDPGYVGWRYGLNTGFNLRLFRRLSWDLQVEHETFFHERYQNPEYAYWRVWNKLSVPVSNHLFLRNITQGSAIRQCYLLSGAPDQSLHTFTDNLLLTYEYSPLSNMYFGVNLNDFNRWDNLVDNLQVYFKINYLLTL